MCGALKFLNFPSKTRKIAAGKGRFYSESNDAFVISQNQKSFSNFFCMFLNPDNFFPILILIVLIYEIYKTSRNKLKKYSVTRNCSFIV